ncbi:orotate phosphoribosyltransferase [Bacillus iocasae]|uniref:Orotate phosphoribosyltransferase n=1 Tax=Priestia iocasae TaxID=2291674 RepID=A0ABS2QQS1_9BACI|nr:orotate phosphoribosyltransferase [Metabacillus iocasae]MBM7701804.1 orotate phosphoribosyltransferase [Metabacillus iocasae]
MNIKKEIAKQLIDIKAVTLQPNEPFTWASGIKSPIYCDNRLTLSYPEVRKEIAKGLQHLIRTYFNEVNVIAGTATAGIPHAAWVSEGLELPMCYVRSKAKEHGRGNQIEGKVEKGQKVVVVEDLISTGGSVMTAVEALQDAGCEVAGVVSIFTYELEAATELFKRENVKVFSLSDYSTLIEVAVEENAIEQKEIEKLLKWRANPRSEQWMKEEV